jgi:hypothetical protein
MLTTYTSKQYDFIVKEINKHNEELHYRGIDERIYKSALRYESVGSDNSRSNRNDVGQQARNGSTGGIYQGKSEGNRGTDNQNSEYNNRSDEGVTDSDTSYSYTPDKEATVDELVPRTLIQLLPQSARRAKTTLTVKEIQS